MILSQNCIDFDMKTFRFGHISGPSYRGAHVGWPAGWVFRRMPWVKRGGGGRWGRELGRREKGERRERVRTNSVLGGHPDTRAESMISTNLEQISAAERTDGFPWVDLGVGRVARRAPALFLKYSQINNRLTEHEFKMHTVCQKMVLM